jgi:radical SAM protein with 4Fe4S-binding SPASM domain
MQRDEVDLFRPALYWYLTDRCNLRCGHCWINAEPSKKCIDEMTLTQATDLLTECARLGVPHITFSGGEPLLYPHAGAVFEKAVSLGLPFGVETNGLLVDDAVLTILREAQKVTGAEVACVSLDGGDRESHEALRGQHTFRRTVYALQRMQYEKVPFMIQCVLHRKNTESIPAIFEIAHQVGARQLSFAVLHPVGRGIAQLERIGFARRELLTAVAKVVESASRAKNDETKVNIKIPPGVLTPGILAQIDLAPNCRLVTGCGFPKLAVFPNGDVSLCALTRGKTSFGNVRSEPLGALMDVQTLSRLRREYVEAKCLEGVCQDCRFRFHCRGGCRTWAEAEFGSLQSPNPFCEALRSAGGFPEIYLTKRPEGGSEPISCEP